MQKIVPLKKRETEAIDLEASVKIHIAEDGHCSIEYAGNFDAAAKERIIESMQKLKTSLIASSL